MGKLDVKKGDKFGRLTIVKEIDRYVSPKGESKRVFNCVCECGNYKNVILHHLKQNKVLSCGCYQKEVAKQTITEISVKHSCSKTIEHNTWVNMKQRCYNTNNKDYKNYGGRGIIICDRWLNSFENFLEDMGYRPEGASIDRINNDGNYEPSNCRWASRIEQNKNRRPKSKKRDGEKKL